MGSTSNGYSTLNGTYYAGYYLSGTTYGYDSRVSSYTTNYTYRYDKTYYIGSYNNYAYRYNMTYSYYTTGMYKYTGSYEVYYTTQDEQTIGTSGSAGASTIDALAGYTTLYVQYNSTAGYSYLGTYYTQYYYKFQIHHNYYISKMGHGAWGYVYGIWPAYGTVEKYNYYRYSYLSSYTKYYGYYKYSYASSYTTNYSYYKYSTSGYARYYRYYTYYEPKYKYYYAYYYYYSGPFSGTSYFYNRSYVQG